MIDEDSDFDPETPLPEWAAMRETTLAQLEVRLADLDEHAASQDVLLWLDRMSAFLSAVKAARNAVFELAVAWVKENGDLIVNDQIRYTVGYQRTVRCLDIAGTLQAALSAANGDLASVAGLISINGFKHGACRGAFTRSDYDRLFQTEVRCKLVPGASRPPLRLQRIDDRYATPSIGTQARSPRPNHE